MSSGLFNAFAYATESIAGSQLLDASAVVSRTDFHSFCRLDRLDPEVLSPGMPYCIRNDLLDAAKNGLRTHGIVNAQILRHIEMNLGLRNVFSQCADRSPEIEAVITPETVYDLTDVLQEKLGD